MKYTNFKLKLRACLAILVLFVFAAAVNAQQTSISGIVKDASNGEPILGANILEKGTSNGTITNLDGQFTLKVAANATLIVRYIGFASVEVPVAGQKNIVIQIKEDAVALGEVVAIGYGVVKKNDATGSVTAIKPDKLNKGVTTSAQDMIVGKIAGVSVITGGGTPGSGATIRIRGGSSLNASNDPLIVIDGLAMDNDGIKGVANYLSTINPNDIETFTVLKDASATAIYGSRASNGVIIINTKKGLKGSRPRISYDGNTSIGIVGKTVKVLSGDEYRTYAKLLYADQPAAVAKLGTASTDWQSQIYQAAISHDHTISVTGGFKNVPYRASVGYTNQDGILKTSNFERYTAAISLSPSLFDDHLKINLNAKGMLVKNRYADNGAISAAISMDPTQPVTSKDAAYAPFGGYWQWTQNGTDGLVPNPQATKNPLATLMQKDETANSRDLIGSAEFDYKVHFMPDLHLHLNLGIDDAYGKQILNLSKQAASDFPHGRTGWDKQSKRNTSLNYYMQYGKEVGIHRYDVMAGYEWQHFYREGTSEFVGLDGYNPVPSIFKTESYLVSFFGRVNYTLADKYLFTATVRNDRSSRFAANNRSAIFPALAFAWKINEEGFLKDNNTISDLKLRLGYGITGQQNLTGDQILYPEYAYFPVYTINKNGAFYPFGSTYYNTSRPDAYNSKLKWEETTTWNAGLDFGFFKSRLTGSIDYYYRNTKDLINVVTAPASTNFRNKVVSNVGTLKNTGVEFTLNAKAISTKDLTWEIGYNATVNRNKITKLTMGNIEGYYVPKGGLFQGFAQAHAVGFPASSFYVYEQIYDTNHKPIEGLYVDRNGDHVINEKDKYFYHNPDADVTMGFSSKIIYKSWDFGFSLRASIGNYMYNAVDAGGLNVGAGGVYSSLGYFSNKLKSAFDTNFSGGSNTYLSDYYVQNASFIRCDNVTIGYSFKGAKKSSFSGRVYTTFQNPFVFTKYKGLDPEISGGIDNNIYPRPIVTMLGVSLNF